MEPVQIEAAEPTIIYEDADMLAIAKPAGMMTHPDQQSIAKRQAENAESVLDTVSDWFAKCYPESAHVGEPQTLPNGTVIMRPGIVHRLDRDTSGVLLLAKTQDAHARLKTMFQERIIRKTYLAIVYDSMPTPTGVCTYPIGRSSSDFRLKSAQRGAKGTLREAVTRWETVSVISDKHTPSEKYALLKVYPETGRTHQIRVHLKALHHPIVCDPLYAPKRPCVLGLSRVALHAYAIDCTNAAGEPLTITAPIPAEMREAVERFAGTEDLLAA